MKKYLLAISILPLLFACNSKEFFDGPNQYAEDFEAYNQIDDMLSENDERWSYFQLTYPENQLTIDSSFAFEGNQCIKSFAQKSTDANGASKCSFSKQNMAFWENERVTLSAWYYMVGDADAQWIFLMDLEEQVAIGAGPGMRLAMVDNAIRVEHKYFNPDIIQPAGGEVLFPRNQWVHLVFETKLSKKHDGYVKVWQDDVLILNQQNWKTLPTDLLYFQQGTKGMYSSIEFGITANTHDNDMVVYVDDISVYTN